MLSTKSRRVVRPIAVGETLRRLAGKCVCALLQDKAAEFSSPCNWVGQVQRRLLMVSGGTLRSTGWIRISFSSKLICKSFSRQAVLDECSTCTFFPELIPWVSWCYGSHPLLGTHLARSLLNPECSKVTPWVLETKVHRLERPWVNALYAECGECGSNTCPGAYFIFDILVSEGFRANGHPKTTLSSTLVPANSCLALSACSGLVTKNAFKNGLVLSLRTPN